MEKKTFEEKVRSLFKYLLCLGHYEDEIQEVIEIHKAEIQDILEAHSEELRGIKEALKGDSYAISTLNGWDTMSEYRSGIKTAIGIIDKKIGGEK